MDTNSKNNHNDQKSWQQLASNASKAVPPDDLDVLDGVKRAVAAEQWAAADSKTVPPSGWLDELAGVLNQKWAIAGLSVMTVVVAAFGVAALGASQDLSLAVDLSAFFNPL